ncbi:Transcriptional activator Myb, partial [Anabarilius grahami]
EDEDDERHSTDPDSRDPKNSKKTLCKIKWSRDEDEKLKKLVEQHGTDAWKLIANYFPTRTDGQCQHRWQKVLNPELVKGPWTKEEDQRPCHDDPDKEKRIKELELLLMSAESEVRRQSGPRVRKASRLSFQKRFVIARHSGLVGLLFMFADQGLYDPLAWSDVTSFDLSEGGPSPKPTNPTEVCPTLERCTESLAYSINASTVPAMSRQCAAAIQGKSVALSNTCMNRFSSPPTSMMRKKRREREDQSPADERNCGAFIDNSGNSPKNTPVKGLPFSPSQPQPLALLEEDIREVLKEETGSDIFTQVQNHLQYRSYEQMEAPARKVRKSLVLDNWEKDCLNVQLFPQQQINNNAVANSNWEAVVFGKTEDQLIMTEQARRYLNTNPTACISRALVL